MRYVAVLDHSGTIGEDSVVLKRALCAFVATLDLALADVVLTGACAGPQIGALIEGVAPGEVRVASHLPDCLSACVVVPWLRVVPEVMSDAGHVRDVRVDRMMLLLDNAQVLVFIHRLRHCEVVGGHDLAAETSTFPGLRGILHTLPLLLLILGQDAVPVNLQGREDGIHTVPWQADHVGRIHRFASGHGAQSCTTERLATRGDVILLDRRAYPRRLGWLRALSDLFRQLVCHGGRINERSRRWKALLRGDDLITQVQLWPPGLQNGDAIAREKWLSMLLLSFSATLG